MPPLHKLLKLQANGRGSIHGRFTRTKGANQQLANSSDHNLAVHASVVKSFVTLLSSARCPARALDTTSFLTSLGPLTFLPSFRNAESINSLELVPTPVPIAPQQRSLHQPSQPPGDFCKDWCRQSSVNSLSVHLRGRPPQVISKAELDGGPSHHGLPTRSLTDCSRSIISTLQNGAFGRMSRMGSTRNCVEENEKKVERTEWPLDIKAGLEMVWRLSKTLEFRDIARPRGASSLHTARQIGPCGAESWRSFQNCLLCLGKNYGAQVGLSVGRFCTTPTHHISTANRRSLQKQDLAGQGGIAAVNSTTPGNALPFRFYNHRRGVKSAGRVSPLRAAHEVSLARDGAASRTEHQSDESARAGHTLKFQCGACNLPHPEKLKTGGEDAYFICRDKHVFGVADGVGGWSDLGIDAGEYARDLMSHAASVVRDDAAGCMDPLDVMEKAHSLTHCRGSATACILALTDSSLEAANLGDSGFMVVRNNRTVFKSPSQQHMFNIPFQLEHGGSDPPRTAQVFSVPVREGDVVITGTDGLFDNVYDTELITLVVQAGRGHATPQVTAERIANLARSHAKDKNRQTPFATAAQDAGFRIYGGKMDDITVIVSYIMSAK